MKFKYILSILLIIFCATTVQAGVVTKTIAYQQNGENLEGYLAYDDSIREARPAVLIVHEWWGLNDYARGRAEQLASLGFVAFALDMYGVGKVTEHPKQAGEWAKQIGQNVQAWRDRAQAGLEVLRKQPQTDRKRIAAIGYCFGGSTVQQLAYGGAALRGVVSFHGSLLPPPEGAGSEVNARILIAHGAADPLNSPEKVQKYLTAMELSGLDYQFIAYGGAKHAFTNPNADKKGIAALGYNKTADRRSWQSMPDFFNEIFKR